MIDWALPLLVYAAALGHHVFAIRAEERTRVAAAKKREVARLLREACALARYGASDEAQEALARAVELELEVET